VAFACLKPGRFPAVRRNQKTPLIAVPMRSRFDIRPAWRLARLVRDQGFNIIHSHTPRSALVGQIAARLTGVPLVHHVHGHTATEVGRGWLARLAAQTERLSLSRAAAIIAVSPTAAQYIHLWGVPQERIHLVPNGVPGCKHLPNRRKPQGVWTLGMIALLRPRKGLEVLLHALAILHQQRMPVQLCVIGGFETPHFQTQTLRLVAELGLSNIIRWRGFQQDIDAELAELDLLVFPSVLPEGMPMAVLEAMAAGVPTIGSRVKGIVDAIRSGHDGLLTEPGDARGLAHAVSSVISGEHNWQFLHGNAVASHTERFSDTAMAAGVAEVYHQVMKQ
jgi:glycosyltransferase involved in cell wall biosynthesis